MDKMRMESIDMIAQNIDKIGALFPNCITETVDENGKPKKAINFKLLRQMLSGDVVDGDEAYEFTWVGKKASIVEANKPIRKTLRPCKEESMNWDTTENLYIEGDNLEVLKLLQESYLNKVKMIYIDPPYNTGHDFVYPDTFIMDNEEYNEGMGYFDEDGNINYLRENGMMAGKYHSDWCSMIYSRLMLARNLLTDDGAVFISINDYEVENLKKICKEVFGEKNVIACFCWKTDGNFDNQAKIKICHEYILLCSKNEAFFCAPPVVDPSIPKNSKVYKDEVRNTIIKNGPKNPISMVELPIGFPCDIESGIVLAKDVVWPQYSNDIVIENYKTVNSTTAKSGWSSNAQLKAFISNNFESVTDTKGQLTRFLLTKTGAIEAIKKRDSVSHVISVLQNLGGPQKASGDLEELSDCFDYPKPVSLLKYLCSMVATNSNDIVMDFFSGSATTAHAVMQLNIEDSKCRNFIMIQLPEPCEEKSPAFKAGYKNICEIGKERIRRAGTKIKEESPLTTQDLDIGFRVLKLDESNMNDVYYSADEYQQNMLSMLESNVKEDRTDLDLLFGCLLEWGLPLSLPYFSEKIEGCAVHTYGVNQEEALDIIGELSSGQKPIDRIPLIACFDEAIPDSVIKEIARRQPLRAVFRDSSFASSPSKINVGEIFKMLAPDTRIKVI